jgi:hypothetical protein
MLIHRTLTAASITLAGALGAWARGPHARGGAHGFPNVQALISAALPISV